MIDTIVFDLGNVLVDFCWEKCFKTLGYEGECFEKLANATVRTKEWDLHDKGDYSDEEMLSKFIANDPSIEKQIRTIYDNLPMMIELRDYSEKWINTLKSEGFKVYILSNFSRKCYYECGSKLDIVRMADGAVLSFEEKLIKPDEEIYNVLLKRFNIEPSHSVFIDDRSENIATARRLGMNGIVFETKSQVITDLKDLIGITLSES